ncbi:MAG: branched-chain amino acid ABC transporter permease [Chloroflexi bacterium]|nr:branched-chain amino acid ABC transporter permease [Chloroflexota bacterium]
MSRQSRFWSKNPNATAVIALGALVLLIGYVEIAQPFGLTFADLTGGLVTLDTMIRIAIFTIILVGLNLLMGYAGQISLGQAAFYGIGAYVSAILTTLSFRQHVLQGISVTWWWPWLAMVLAMLVTGLFAYIMGRPILRLRGNYLAMATLGLGIVMYIVFREGGDLTGGNDGIGSIPRLAIGGFEIWPMERYYFLVWVLALAVIILALNIVNSRIGRALRAIHSSEIAANTMGVDTDRYKLQILTVSAMMASLAGSLYAHYQMVIAPSPFDFNSSVELVVMAAVGGLASIWGAPFGVAVVLILQEILRNFSGAGFELVAFGFILVAIMIFMPEGLTVGGINAYRHWRAVRARRKEIEDSVEILGAQ